MTDKVHPVVEAKCPNCDDEGVFIRDGGVYICLDPRHAKTAPKPKRTSRARSDMGV
jgi:hypothetical protein